MKKIKNENDCNYFLYEIKSGKEMFFSKDHKVETMLILQYDALIKMYWLRTFDHKKHTMKIETLDEAEVLNKLFESKEMINIGYILK
jgi:hypothetical protein